ncbi:MAG: hypothetical protein KGY69_10365 [Bacteroidales bacterium]|nr:hypothetical protein [Bacteroidales bacterium]
MNFKSTFKKMLGLSIILLIFFPSLSFSGNTSHRTDAEPNQPYPDDLAVFLDLRRWVDEDYIRQEIPMVEYVRDKEFADVHVLMSRHDAGRSGTEYVISFIGTRKFEGMKNELTYWAPASQTDSETRAGYTNMIKIGLAPYLANIEDMQNKISLQYAVDSVTDEKVETTEKEDPWNSWVFEIYAGGYFDSEKTRNSTHIRYGFYADKVTKEWKIRARPYFNYNERNYQINGSTVNSTTRRDGFDGYLIKSITDHWAAGTFTDMLSSTYHNMDFQIEVSPAVEYSLFPYSEATRRAITFAYKLDYSYNDYIEETIYGETAETLWGHSLVFSVDCRQTWGSIEAGLVGSQHFHDLNSNRLELFTELSLRIFKGFSLTAEVDFEFINDLVAIPKSDMSTEEILLEQRRRSTNYELDAHIGFTYTFGSDLSGAFNPRLNR